MDELRDIHVPYSPGDIQTQREGSGNPEFQKNFEKIMVEHGENFFWYLEVPLQKLETIVDAQLKEKKLLDTQICFVFLDRDSRPALHAWQTLTQNRFQSIPLPLSNAQFPDFSRQFEEFLQKNDSVTYEKFKLLSENFIRSYIAEHDTDVHHWQSVLVDSLRSQTKDKKRVYIVDIGFNGSMVEMARYLLKDSIDETILEPVLLYGTKTPVPHLENGVSTGIEHKISHATIGYLLKKDGRYRYLRETGEASKLEELFMRGIKKAAQKSRDSLKDK